MKRCPECDSVFPDTDKFCELDGAPLVAADPAADLNSDFDPDLNSDLTSDLDRPAAADEQTEQKFQNVSPLAIGAARQSEQGWKTIAITAVAGVAIGVVLFVVYYAMTRSAPTESSNQSAANSSIMPQLGPLLPPSPSPDASASPSVEPSPSPSVMPSPSTQTNTAPVQLSSSPISTGDDAETKRGPVIIRLTDGASIEADEAWQTGEGIWYRKGGVVTLLDPKQVKKLERVPPATPQPSPSQSPSP